MGYKGNMGDNGNREIWGIVEIGKYGEIGEYLGEGV